MGKYEISRRDFLRATAMAAAGLAAAACAKTPTEAPATATPKPAAPTATTAPAKPTPTKETKPTPTPQPKPEKEVPQLSAAVKAGTLPPQAERIPQDVWVVEPFGDIGTYGGTLHMGDFQQNRHAINSMRVIGFFQSSQDGAVMYPDIVKGVEWADNATKLTIHLRRGYKWSDGTPFTVDDIMFWWNDILMNKDLYADPPSKWRPGGEPMTVTKISDSQVEFKFAVPNPTITDGLMRAAVSMWDGLSSTPMHYLKEFHIAYNPNANDLAKAESFEDWTKLFNSRRGTRDPDLWPDKPMVEAWIPQDISTDRELYTRNPYFHWVDPEGNQLPYIDEIDCEITGDREVQILKSSTGDFDFSCYYMNLDDMPVLQENQEKGDFRVLLPKSLRTCWLALMPNQTVEDDFLRELFQNKDFRIAMSIGINRQAMNEALFFGLGVPGNARLHPGVPFYDPAWKDKYAEYDPNQANKILDDLGLTQKDSQGFRLRTDNGERISLRIDIGNEEGPKVAMAEMIKEDWAKIGLEAIVAFQTRPVWEERRQAWNQLQVPTWHVGRAVLPYGRSSPLWFALDNLYCMWGAGWAQWYISEGESGIEPPPEIKDLRDLWDRFVLTVAGSPEYNELGKQYYGWLIDNLVIIGTVGLSPQPLVASNRLKNVPEENISWGSDNSFHSPYRPPQFYLKG